MHFSQTQHKIMRAEHMLAMKDGAILQPAPISAGRAELGPDPEGRYHYLGDPARHVQACTQFAARPT